MVFLGPVLGGCHEELNTTLPDRIALEDRPAQRDLSPQDLWRAALGEMQMRVSEACYRTWLAETNALSWSDGTLTIAAPTAFVAEMLERRLLRLVSDSVEKIAGHGVEVHIEVAGSGAATSAPHRPASVPVDGAPRTETRSGGAQAVSEMRLNPGYTFDSFVVGSSNELAHAAAMAAAERPGAVYNPLFIYSGVGLGKTHLLTAVGHKVRSLGLSTIYTSTEEFTNQYISAIRAGETEAFRGRYRGADVLLLDDIQFLIGKEQTQEGFFHTFNSLHVNGRQIVVTCDRPVAALSVLQDRVRSRLSGGLVVDIQPPDLETRLAILQAKAGSTASAARVSDEALQLLAELAHRNVRELEGSLNRAVAYAELTGGEVTPDAVRRVVSETLARPEPVPLTERMVLDAVAAHFAVERGALSGRRRDARTTLARHVAMYLLREDAHLALTLIGRALGGRDHSTVLHGRNRIAKLISEGDGIRHDLSSLRRQLTSAQPSATPVAD